MFFAEYKKFYPKRDPENLSVFKVKIIVASKIILFLMLKRESPYKSISLLTLSEKDSKPSKTDFTLFIRSKQY